MLVSAALLFVVSSAAAAISPVTVDVTTKDGVTRAVELLDADATPVQVCATRRGSGDAPVCGDVASDRYGHRANVDVFDHGDLVFSLRVQRFDARAAAPAAVAGGLGVVAVGSGVTAFVLGAVAATRPLDEITGAVASNEPDFATASLLLWTVAGASAVGSGVVGFFAWQESQQVVAE